MNIRVRLFAAFREAVGGGELGIELPEGATVGDAWSLLLGQHPGLVGASPSGAVNARVVSADTVLSPGDEIAFLPPVSGG